jgi:hypothetical protein
VTNLEPQRPPEARPSCRPFDSRTRLRGGAASTTSDRPALQRWRQLATGMNAIRLLPQRTWLAANSNHVDPCPKPSCPWTYHREQPGGQRHSIEGRPALSHRPRQELELNADPLQERGLAATSTRTLGRRWLERAGLSPSRHPAHLRGFKTLQVEQLPPRTERLCMPNAPAFSCGPRERSPRGRQLQRLVGRQPVTPPAPSSGTHQPPKVPGAKPTEPNTSARNRFAGRRDGATAWAQAQDSTRAASERPGKGVATDSDAHRSW